MELGRWELHRANGQQVEILVEGEDPATGNYVKTRTIQGPNGEDPRTTREEYRHFGAERWLVKRIQDPGGVALTETIEYYDDPADHARYGKVRQIIKPDGSWLRHEYNDRGRTIATIRPWKDSPAGSQPQEAKAERYASRRLEPGEPFYHPRAKLNETWTTVLGVETSRTFSVTSYDNDDGKITISERAHSPEAKFGDEKNLRTVSRYYPNTAGPASRNKLRETTSQTGEVTRYTYTYGDYLGLEAVPGDFQPAEDAPLRDWLLGTMDLRTERIEKDTKTVTITAPDGKTLLSQMFRRSGAALPARDAQPPNKEQSTKNNAQAQRNKAQKWSEISWTAHAYDFLGRKTLSRNQTGIIGEWRYNPCCNQVEWHRDANGTVTTYQYDDFGHIVMKSNTAPLARAAQTPAKKGQNTTNQAQIEIQTWNTYNVHGQLVKSTITTGPEDENPQITTRAYDSLGRLVATTAPNGFITRYDPDANTTTAPTGVTRKTESYLDGRQKSTKVGTESYVQTNDYGVNADTHQLWTLTTQKAEGELGGEVWTRSYTNFLGQGIRTERPGPAASKQILVSLQSYDDFGRSTSLTAFSQSPNSDLQPLGASSLTEYDSETGEIVLIGQDIDGNGDLEEASTDRISRSETRYEIGPDDHWWQIRQSWIWPKTGDATKVKISAVYSRSGQLGEMDENHGQVVSITHNVPPVAKADANVDRSIDWQSMFAKAATTIVYRNREKSRLTSITTTAAGHQTREISVGGLVRSIEQWQVDKEPTTKNQPQLQHFTRYSYDAMGRRVGITDGRTGISIITYDPKTGDVTKTTDAAGNSTTYTYYGQGELGAGKIKSITNAQGNTQYFAYNQHGQKITTWGETDYPVLYQYDAFGDLAEMRTMHEEPFPQRLAANPAAPPTRKEWLARYETHVTRWIRDPFTRKVIRKEYHDGNGNKYVYTVDGKLLEETSARGAKTVREYDKRTGELTKITQTLGDENTEVIYERDRIGNLIAVTDETGRRTFERDEFARETAEILPNGHRIERDYADDSNRLSVVRLVAPNGENVYYTKYSYNPNGTLAAVESDEGHFEYGYVDGAPKLPASLKGPVGHTTFGYEENRNLIIDVHNQRPKGLGEVPSTTNKAQFDTVSRFTYANDDSGRRTSVEIGGPHAGKSGWHWGYNGRSELVSADPANSDLGTFAYEFDGLGNRETTTEGHITTTYQSNGLNQYTSAQSTEQPQGSESASRKPNFTFEYDLDGNLLSDGKALYYWNAKNRLIRVKTKTGVIATYQYDYLGRRTRKSFTKPDGSTSKSEFVYDGWNVIAEFETQSTKDKGQSTKNSAVRYYTWGRDLSGTLQGAGGVGALLSIRIDNDGTQSELLYPSYDANGNIAEVIDEQGMVRAGFQYGPFGNLISQKGDLADEIPFRFSTKYLDRETGFRYYGFRYFNADTAQWISRDPIGYKGGLNLYTILKNQTIGTVDFLGLSPHTPYDTKREARLHAGSAVHSKTAESMQTGRDSASDIGLGDMLDLPRYPYPGNPNINVRYIGEDPLSSQSTTETSPSTLQLDEAVKALFLYDDIVQHDVYGREYFSIIYCFSHQGKTMFSFSEPKPGILPLPEDLEWGVYGIIDGEDSAAEESRVKSFNNTPIELMHSHNIQVVKTINNMRRVINGDHLLSQADLDSVAITGLGICAIGFDGQISCFSDPYP